MEKMLPETLEVLRIMYEEQRAQARYLGTQRTTVSNLLLTLSVAILALIGHLKFQPSSLPLALFLILIGICGCLVCSKLYERTRFHLHRSSHYRKKLDELFQEADILKIKSTSDKEHSKEFPKTEKIKLNLFWVILNSFIVVLGIGCATAIIIKW